jgi:hypothetical protein
MDPAIAAKLVEALDAELARRQSKKDEVEDARWVEECKGDEINLMARRLSRAWDRPHKGPVVSAPTSREDEECMIEALEDYAKTLSRWPRRSTGTRRARRPGLLELVSRCLSRLGFVRLLCRPRIGLLWMCWRRTAATVLARAPRSPGRMSGERNRRRRWRPS